MNYKNFLLSIIFLMFVNCSVYELTANKKDIIFNKGFANRGFTLVYDKKSYNDGLISEKIDERSLIIFQKNLKINTQIRITNISNGKSLIAKVGKKASYPLFNNSVISKRIADELDLNLKEPYVEILEMPENSIFIAKKAKTFDEEREVEAKAPVNSISINDLNESKVTIKPILEKKFSYYIKIADFYFSDTAKMMISRIINETENKNPKIMKINNKKYRVYLGSFNNINSLQKSYNDIRILKFENIEIMKND